MHRRARSRLREGWPFWLLLVAWLCANSPQVAVFSVLTWLTEARSFSHQQRLAWEVAHVLGAEKAPSVVAAAVARAQKKVPAKPLAPPAADLVLKKIELSLEKTSEVLPVALRADHPRLVGWECPEPRRAPPPHGRPRETNVG